jgi:ABC-2 type transport system permease protein
MTSFAWRVFPIFLLTVRQFLAGRAARVVVALAMLPALFALIFLFGPADLSPYRFLVTQFQELVLPTLLPIAVLLLATAAFGNELEDRTLPYLTMKPIGRWRIVLEKWLAVVVIALPAMLAGLVLSTLIAGRNPVDTATRTPSPTDLWPLLGAMAASTLVGLILLASVFLLVSLVAPRALLVGMVYVFAWESLLGRLLPGVQTFSIRHAAESVFVALLADPGITLEAAASVRGAATAAVLVSLAALILATFRLRTMNLE